MSVFADMTDRHQPSEARESSSNVVSLPSRISAAAVAKAEHQAITGAMRDYCEMKQLEFVPTQGALDIALTMWRNGASPAMAIEEGRKAANKLASGMKQVRARLGLDDGPQAA